MRSRLLALVAAAAMIGGSLLIRAQLDDEDDGNGGDRGDGPAAGDLTLACDVSLRAVCQGLAEESGLEVVIEDMSATRARLEAPDARPNTVGIGAWLTLDPLPGIVTEKRSREGLPPLLGDPVGPLARSPLVLVGWNDRAAALADDCGGSLTWRCIGDRAGAPWTEAGGQAAWGRVEPGVDDRTSDATSLLLAGQAAASFFEGPDFASNDFDTGGFRSWWSELWDAVPRFPATRGTVLDQMLAAGPASYDVVGATEAYALPAVTASRERGNVAIEYPRPLTTADVVLVAVRGAPGGGQVEELASDADLADLLARAGWRVEGRDPPAGPGADLDLPADNGLPTSGVLEALRRL